VRRRLGTESQERCLYAKIYEQSLSQLAHILENQYFEVCSQVSIFVSLQTCRPSPFTHTYHHHLHYRILTILSSNIPFHPFLISRYPSTYPIHHPTLLTHLPNPRRKRTPKSKQPISRQNTQPNRQRLPRLDSPWHRATSQHNRSKETEFDAVRLAVTYAEAAEDVLVSGCC
jgi:hypothetical protein